MKDKIQQLKEELQQDVQSVKDAAALESVRIKYLGRKGALAQLMKQLGSLPADEKPAAGQALNRLKGFITQEIEAAFSGVKARPRGKTEKIDITMPGIRPDIGRSHHLTQTVDEICRIFSEMGFKTVEGPEVETDYYNFQALNIPTDHPSRDAFDTFFLNLPPGEVLSLPKEKSKKDSSWLLRSQTSTVQIRVMEKQKPPLAIIAPGKVFRPDAVDASHSFMFHQVEGFFVDENVTFADLKAALYTFARKMFGPDIKLRFRPHFFPFTEPSVEVDISSTIGKKGWLEILGAGMIDPEVFKAVGYNTKKYTGFAFGMGVERIAMLKHGINDIRLFFENDLRFLNQF